MSPTRRSGDRVRGAPMSAPGRVLALVVWFVVLWCALWGEFTAANIVSGVVVAVGLVVLVRLPASADARFGPGRIRPLRALWFLLFFLVQVVRSNLVLARDIVTPGDSTAPGIIGIPLDGCSDAVVTLVANTFTLTPGSLTIEVTRHPTVIYVHVLYLHDVDAVRSDLLHFAELAVRAFGTESALAQFREQTTRTTEADS